VAAAREVLAGHGEGVAVLVTAAARAHAATGPVGRASGRDLDLRRDDPYGAYAEVFEASDVVTATAGDAAARWSVMIAEVGVSRQVVLRALDRLVPGPVQARVPRTLRVPEGACWVWTETPQGAGGYYLVSRGGTSPYRAAVRSATFATASAWSAALPGTREADLPAALASLPVLSGDIDR
jgi:NADH-quinone oxidoreductase subunit D